MFYKGKKIYFLLHRPKIFSLVQTVRNIWPCSPWGYFHRGLLLLCITVCIVPNPVRIMSRYTVRDITRLINNVMWLLMWRRVAKALTSNSNEASSPVTWMFYCVLFMLKQKILYPVSDHHCHTAALTLLFHLNILILIGHYPASKPAWTVHCVKINK